MNEFRWHRRLPLEDDPAEGYKLNNNYFSRYVRLLIKLHPEMEEMFELRALKGERAR
jgi:hypothetical protein